MAVQRKVGEPAAIDLVEGGRLKKTILKDGSGEMPPADGTHTMRMHYTGKLTDGTIFDSSVSRGTPFEFTLGSRQVILGWDKGVATMRRGEKAILECAPEYAYGDLGAGGVIPPKATLRFEVELLDFYEAGGLFASSGSQKMLFLAVALTVCVNVYFLFYSSS